jgi:hypothetical protein
MVIDFEYGAVLDGCSDEGVFEVEGQAGEG